ncbi:MAG: SIS domain-containing protein [Acidimicrobiia bacterium]|nr:SIS domain-containing protein [Acidimicrobiia bacterium]
MNTHAVSSDAGAFGDDYFSQIARAASLVSRDALRSAAELLIATHHRGSLVFTCGNGGSAAIANHSVTDHCKLVQTDTGLAPRVVSLSSTVEIMTAISNDLSYAEVFEYQLRSLAKPQDTLLVISSSGDSENVVRAARWAKDNQVNVIGLTGFAGGRVAGLADVNLHVESNNYGVVEDVHQSVSHILAQFIHASHAAGD